MNDKVTDWLIRGDLVRCGDDIGQVVGLGDDGRVLLRLPSGVVESWPEDELTGTGAWVRVVDDGEAG